MNTDKVNDRQVAAVAYAAKRAYLNSLGRNVPSWEDMSDSTREDLIAEVGKHRSGFYNKVQPAQIVQGMSHDDSLGELIVASVVRAFEHHQHAIRENAHNSMVWTAPDKQAEFEANQQTQPAQPEQPQSSSEANNQADRNLAEYNQANETPADYEVGSFGDEEPASKSKKKK